MNTNPKNKETLALYFNTGGNSPPANLRYNGSPLAAFKVDGEGRHGGTTRVKILVFLTMKQPSL